jgi:hypothetical protein
LFESLKNLLLFFVGNADARVVHLEVKLDFLSHSRVLL